MQKRPVKGGKPLKALGDRVRELRKRAGISQEALAERCSLHPNYVGYIERGERNVNVLVLFQLAAALSVEPAELFAGITLRDVKRLPRRR